MHPVNHPAAHLADDTVAAVETVRLTRVGMLVRTALLLAVVVGVVIGTWQRNDQGWPFAPMSQFAFATSARNGTINSRYLEATTVTGERVKLDLSRGALGIQRAEIEGQLGLFAKDPSLLQGIAVLHARRSPASPRLATVYVMNDVRQLRDGVVGDAVTRTDVTWQVIDPTDPKELP
jgi:hypothetical protein